MKRPGWTAAKRGQRSVAAEAQRTNSPAVEEDQTDNTDGRFVANLTLSAARGRTLGHFIDLTDSKRLAVVTFTCPVLWGYQQYPNLYFPLSPVPPLISGLLRFAQANNEKTVPAYQIPPSPL